MSDAPYKVFCSGCGAQVDPSKTLPFACKNAKSDDNIDHMIQVEVTKGSKIDEAEDHPFLRYGPRLLSWHMSVHHTNDARAYQETVRELDRRVREVDGVSFHQTPVEELDVGEHAPLRGQKVVAKIEAGHVSGSHKARHLFHVMVYMRLMQRLDLPVAKALEGTRLAIASCGNAALGAAVVAKAANWPLDVFVPPDGAPAVLSKIRDLGGNVVLCHREAGVPGDPCYHRFRDAVQAGSVPFGVQGNQNGLAIEGGKVLGYELFDQLDPGGNWNLVLQVGGGALASGCIQAWLEQSKEGVCLYTVQTEGAAPLARAFARFESLGGTRQDTAVTRLRTKRSEFMWPWEAPPSSIAHGILDDETYDWRALVCAMSATGGSALVVTEKGLRAANRLANRKSSHTICHTGSAGLAGVLQLATNKDAGPPANWAVVLTGVER